MASSSSEERSPSRRRSPNDRSRSRDPAAGDAASKEDGAETKEDNQQKWRWHKASQPARSVAPSRARGGGARKNYRRPGAEGTWTCDDCGRTVDKNEVSIKQHRRSVFCVARQLWNGGKETDWNMCKQLAESVNQDEDLEIHDGRVWRRRLDRPKSPLGKPPTAEHGDMSRGRSRSGQKERRSASRGGRNRRLRLQERTPSRSRARRRRSATRTSRAGAKTESEKLARASGRHAAEGEQESGRAANNKGTREKHEASKVKKPHDAEKRASAEKESKVLEEKKEKESSSYEYTYSSSSDEQKEGEPAEAEPKQAASAQPKANPKASAAPAMKKKEKAEAAAAPRGSGEAKQGPQSDHDRRTAMFNSLLRTAMETAGNF